MGDTMNTTVKAWIHLTLQVYAENCTQNTLIVTAEKIKTTKSLQLICRFVQNNASCTVAKKTFRSCRCTGWYDRGRFSVRMEQPEESEYRWRWRQPSSGWEGEKKIKVHVASKHGFMFNKNASIKNNELWASHQLVLYPMPRFFTVPKTM